MRFSAFRTVFIEKISSTNIKSSCNLKTAGSTKDNHSANVFLMSLDLSKLKLDLHFVAGEWVQPLSNDRFPIVNPATEQHLGHISLANKEDVQRAVEAAHLAFKDYSLTSKQERVSLLEKLLAIVEKRFEDLAWSMTKEMGAPITMAREAQAETGLGHLKAFIQALKDQKESTTLPSGDLVYREPIGVCGLITPWNWPINQIALKVIPALATGCTCVLKPSEHTPLSAIVFAECIEEAGYPPGVFNLIHGSGEVAGSELSKHPLIQMMSFTGSTRAGRAVSKNASETIKRVTLELGGKSPNILFEDCDLEAAIPYSMGSCFYNTGQSCDAPTRLLVQRSIYPKVVELIKEAKSNYNLGNPDEEGDHLGPLFDRIQFERVQNLIQIGIEEGAELLFGGLGKPEGFETGFFVHPTVFVGVHNRMRIAQEEIFGPVMVVIPFETEEEAIELANDTPYGLAAYLQSRDSDRIQRVMRALKAGSIYVNGGSFNYGSPFGGFKQSGNGREGGVYGLEDYQELKSVHIG